MADLITGWITINGQQFRMTLSDAAAALAALGGQTSDATLTALATLNGTPGLVTQTAADTFTKRSLAVGTQGITWANADGSAGNPTLSLASVLESIGVAGKVQASHVDTNFIVNRAYSEYTTNAALSTLIPVDDTIPQNTEGTEIVTASITPKTTTNRVRVRFEGWLTSAVATTHAAAALFINTTANALAVSFVTVEFGSWRQLVLEFEHVPASTSAQTYKIRVGGETRTVHMNGGTAGRFFGGAARATLVLEEIKA